MKQNFLCDTDYNILPCCSGRFTPLSSRALS